MKGDTEACLEHGGCEGLEGHPEEGIRRCQAVVEAGDRWGKRSQDGRCGGPGFGGRENTSLEKSALGYFCICISKKTLVMSTGRYMEMMNH